MQKVTKFSVASRNTFKQQKSVLEFAKLYANITNLTQYSYSTSQQYDCVVIGGGPGGYVAAIKAAQLGLKVKKRMWK